jgi:serralysin
LTSFGFTAGPDGTVPIAMKDLNGDGKAEVIAGGGVGTSQVRVINGGTGGLFRSFMAFTPSYTGGVYVG